MILDKNNPFRCDHSNDFNEMLNKFMKRKKISSKEYSKFLSKNEEYVSKTDQFLKNKLIAIKDKISDYYRSKVNKIVKFSKLNDKELEKILSINNNPDTSIHHNFQNTQIEDFIKNYGKEITTLCLKKISHFKNLIKHCPNLKHLTCRSMKIKDKHFESLSDLKLESANFIKCIKITGEGIKHFNKMPIKKLNFSGCYEFRNNSLSHLQNMNRLEEINFSACINIKNSGINLLNNLQLKIINFSHCTFNGKGFASWKNVLLEEVDFSYNPKLKNNVFVLLKENSIKSAKFASCTRIDNEALKDLGDTLLEEIDLSGMCLEDKDCEFLKNLPLKIVDLSKNKFITEKTINYLKGKQLHSINLAKCSENVQKLGETLLKN